MPPMSILALLLSTLVAPAPAPAKAQKAPVAAAASTNAPAWGRFVVIRCAVDSCTDATGQTSGPVELLWPDGTIWRKGNVEHGKPHGEWTSFYPDGGVMLKVRFAHGKAVGKPKAFDEEGAPMKLAPLTKAQRRSLGKRAAKLAEAADAVAASASDPAPAGSSAKQAKAWAQQSTVLAGIAERLRIASLNASTIAQSSSKLAAPMLPVGGFIPSTATSSVESPPKEAQLGGVLEGVATGPSMVAEMMVMNMQFLALQNAMQMESRKFQTLSNASSARHEIARNAIANLKA